MPKKIPTNPPALAARFQDWPCRFYAFLEERRATPFAWGSNDCCLFVCDGIRATTGLDPAAKMFRGKYHDATGAARLLKKHGGVEAVASTVCAELGFPEVSVAMARRGDVVLMSVDRDFRPLSASQCDVALRAHDSLGLCDGSDGVFISPDGQVRVPIKQCRRAWRVG